VSHYTNMQPHRPTHLPDYAEVCLQALAHQGLGSKISLGGAFGLLHYLDYRPTHDVDAWQTHLARIAQHRPLEEIADPAQRTQAESVRSWFAMEFLNALLD
jgi:hypothetical protein